jgi:predicted nucleic acid-binding protein
MKWVVDASVAAKWVAPEPGSDRAARLLKHELLAPDLLYAEWANILWKKQVRREMSPQAVGTSVRWMRQVPIDIRPCQDLLDEAVALSSRLQHPAYDCFYLALAREAGCAVVTADRRLWERCQAAGSGDLSDSVVWLERMAPA